ncbi:unnamed protein product [Urochloa decumbens]|uniref:Flavin-containing monooxygenase n=1 Tax=Urochloa decumbens TaxID=240449 RepID=A0ABC9BTJ5_9POAL
MAPVTTTTLFKLAAAGFSSLRAVAALGKLELTHAELDALVDAAAARLADGGVLPGHPVALSSPNTAEGVIMVLAVMRAGAVAVPLDPDYTEEQFEVYLSGSKARLLFTGVEGNAAAQAAAAKLGVVHATASLEVASGPVHIDGLPAVEAHAGNGNAGFSTNNSDPRDVALLLYYPGEMRLTHSDLAAHVHKIRSESRLTETDALVVRLPLFHDLGLLSSLFAYLASGASVTLRGPDLVIVVGAGPSGLAVAACLREKGVRFVLLEREDRIAPLWHKAACEGLKLHLHKTWSRELPLMPFPDDCPEEYPTALQYNHYLEHYAARLEIKPEFNRTVPSARYDETSGLWRVRAADTTGVDEIEYVGRWLIVATGKHADIDTSDIPGLAGFAGEVTHIGDYKSGEPYSGKRVLVVGRGDCGVEVALDLCDHGARTAVAARDVSRFLLPSKVFGKPTLKLASVLLDYLARWLPPRIVDKAKGRVARAVLGDLARLGVRGPVFDCGDLERIRAGDIAVVPAVARFGAGQVEFVDGRAFDIDAVVLATGYRSNLPQATWHGHRNGYPAIAFPYGWDGYCGLYAVGFSRRSFGGASADDAVRVAEEIAGACRKEGTEPAAGHRDRNGVHVVF